MKNEQYRLQLQHILHAVKSRLLLGEPLGGAHGAVGEGVAAAMSP